MTKALAYAMKKIAELPEAAQEEIGIEILERVDTIAWLRAELELGLRDLDAGRRVKIDSKKFIKDLRKRHAKKK